MAEGKSFWKFLDVKEDRPDITIDEKQIQLLRKDRPFRVTNDALRNMAEKFHLSTDDETLQLLSDCLDEDEQTAINTMKDRYLETQDVTKITGENMEKPIVTPAPTEKKQQKIKDIKSTELDEIQCVLEKLKNHEEIDSFVEKFLRKKIPSADSESTSA